MGDLVDAFLLALGGLGFFAGLQEHAGLAVGRDGRCPVNGRPALDRGQRRPDLIHPGADVVDLVKLRGGEQALSYHRPIDQVRSGVVGRRDQVASAEPGVAEPVDPLGGLLDLFPADRQVGVGFETERRFAVAFALVRRR